MHLSDQAHKEDSIETALPIRVNQPTNLQLVTPMEVPGLNLQVQAPYPPLRLLQDRNLGCLPLFLTTLVSAISPINRGCILIPGTLTRFLIYRAILVFPTPIQIHYYQASQSLRRTRHSMQLRYSI